MKLDNRTHWRNDHLKAILARVAADELDGPRRRALTVRVVYGRRGRGSSGVCFGSRFIVIRISSINPDHVDFAATAAHEMAHARGVTHKQMRGSPRYRRVGNHYELYAWAVDMPIERKPVKVRPSTAARRDQRIARATMMLAKWERIHRRAATKIKAWRRRVRATESLIAAASAAAPQVAP